MAVFNFGWLTPGETEYQENGTQLQFGGNYRFDARSPAPPVRIHKIEVHGMRYYTSAGVIDETSHLRYMDGPEMNVKLLEAFYEEHELWKEFQINHPAYGLLVVKFDQPFSRPKALEGGTGMCPPITLALREQQ